MLANILILAVGAMALRVAPPAMQQRPPTQQQVQQQQQQIQQQQQQQIQQQQQQQQQQLYGAEARRAARDAKGGMARATDPGPPRPTPVQGGSLRTWSHRGDVRDHHVTVGTDGRPLNTNVELWEGPGNTPVHMQVYGENGYERPVRAVVRGRGTPSTVALRNTGPMEFPVAANVAPTAPPVDAAGTPIDGPTADCLASATVIQGDGAERTFPFDWTVESVQILITSDGYPVSATIDVLQGPSTVRQGIHLYSDDGRGKPIFYVLETPGYGCVVQITNTGPMEYPVTAAAVPHTVNTEPSFGSVEPVLGGVGEPPRRRGRYDVQ